MQSKILNTITVMLTFSALILVSACSEEQQEAAKNAGETVVEKTDETVDAAKEATGKAWDATKSATKSATDTVVEKTNEAVDATKNASSDAWDATKDAADSTADALEKTGSKAVDKAGQIVQ